MVSSGETRSPLKSNTREEWKTTTQEVWGHRATSIVYSVAKQKLINNVYVDQLYLLNYLPFETNVQGHNQRLGTK